MTFIKIGESLESIKIENTSACVSVINPDILENFKKFAANLKKVAPKAEDFLYFSAVVMHAAEAAALNDDGTSKLNAKGDKVEVGWDKTGGTWRWMSNDNSIKPYKNCFPSGTQILMEDGSVKNIENIKIGDKVISHTGIAQVVTQTFINDFNGNLLELTINNNVKLQTTPEHPFYTLNLENSRWKSDTSPFRIWKETGTTFNYNFIEANKLSDHQFLLSPILKQTIQSSLTPDQARLLGLYAAEGSLNKNSKTDQYRNCVTFTFSSKENSLASLTKKLLEQEFSGIKVTISTDEKNHKCNVYGYHRNVVSFFLKYAGEYSYNKKLHPELVFGSNEVKQQFLLGWFEGDGHVAKDMTRTTCTTVSPSLAYQCRQMLYSLGIHNTLYRQPPSTSKIKGHKVVGKHDIYRLRINSTNSQKLIKFSDKLTFNKKSKEKSLTKFVDNYCLNPLLNKTEIPFSGKVYNFAVENDNSYVANGIVVHNCNGDIFPEEELVKAYKKWVGKPLCVDHKSSSVEHVRGFIVDTYYDRNLKRVVALCALDKAGYPQLARQIQTGMSNCVSMGTAVGKAICSDCARVARQESDFCDHMKHKSCYGEINVDLNPIELSIVMNGADQKATIKHIIAAANTMSSYLDNKKQELEKIASHYQASITFVNDDSDKLQPENRDQVTNVTVTSKDLESFKRDVEKAIEDFQQLQSSIKEEKVSESGNDTAFNKLSDAEADTPTADSGLAPPHARYASVDVGVDTVAELHTVTKAIEAKLNQLKNGLDKLANTSTIQKQEENMSGTNMNKQGYFQGAGGVNEPTPGQVKYPKDPLNEQLRDGEDKQMVGQNGFPGVGPVDGMHPSPVSADQKDELERKKMLARADLEERALRRQAIVNLAKQALEDKKAYFQNGLEKNNVNTPTPGQVKYPKDKLNEQLRDYEDKQMVGQKPFPGVGSVDGLHPSPQSAETADELKRKEMLRRASLRARFIKASNEDGSQNLAKSSWEVFRGDQLILTASVEDLSGGNIDGLYDGIATKEFGVKLIEKVKKDGAEKVLSLFKKAQVPPAPPADSSAVPVAAPTTPPALEAGSSGTDDKGGDGDPKQSLVQLSDKMRDLASDMGEAARALTGEQSEMGDMGSEAPAGELPETPEMGAAAFSNSTLNNLRKELNGALLGALKESIAELNDRREELAMISGLYDKGAANSSNQDLVNTIVDDATTEAKSVIANGFKLMTAFVKYARGTQAIVKRAEIEAELAALSNDGDANMNMEHDASSDEDLMNLINSADTDLDAVNSLLAEDADLEADDNQAMLTVKPGEVVPANTPEGTGVEVKKASFDTLAGRAALRAKLAADATGKEDDGDVQDMSKAKFSDMLQEADHLADGQTELDVKPSDNLGLVETLPEQNKAMLEVAKAPPKVRKEAEAIQKLIVTGKLDPSDLDALVAEGLDKDAVAYWKKYYSQTDGGNEFASELVKEHVKAQLEEELNKFRIKMARAYELAYDMVDRGLCHNDRSAVTDEVDRIMKFNDDAFDSLKRVVAKHAPIMRKEAGRMPQVGMIGGSSEQNVNNQSDDDNLFAQLSGAFSKTSKRVF